MHALYFENNFPPEILAAPVWCVAGRDSEGKTKRPLNPYTRKDAKVNDPSTWGTFEDACATAIEMGLFLPDGVTPAVGHVLRIEDGYFVIDFDKSGSSVRVWETQQQVLELFESYVEESQSGIGMHLYARGSLFKGKRFKSANIEIYGHGRFMVATGRSYLDRPPVDHTLTLAQFICEHAPAEAQFTYNGDSPQVANAYSLLKQNTFVREAFLTPGGWRAWGMSDHSIADFAFMKEILRVTSNHTQALEIFSMSPMGERDKWQERPEYQMWTLENAAMEVEGNRREEERLAMVFYKELISHTDAAPDLRQFEQTLEKAKEEVVAQQQEVIRNYLPAEIAVRIPTFKMYLGIQEPISVAQELMYLPVYESNYVTGTRGEWLDFKINMQNDAYSHVPLHGFLGEFAKEIMHHMHRPSLKVAEMVALVIAQQVIGRGSTINGTGLNLFVNMIGDSGVGKSEAKALATDFLFKLQERYELHDYTINDLPKSKEGLHTAIKDAHANEIMINIDESHTFLKDMQNNSKGMSIAAGTGTLLTDLYALSGKRGRLLGKAASKSENSSNTIRRPFVSLLLYGLHDDTLEAINGDLLKNGFAARVLYMHVRTEDVSATLNRYQHLAQGYSEDSIHRIGCVARFNDRFRSSDSDPFPVDMSEHVLEKHAQFADWIYSQVTKHKKHHFNRGAVNAMKLASIAAIFNDPKAAVITEELYDWAVRFVLSSLNYFERATSTGELGDSHLARRTAIINKLILYYQMYAHIKARRRQVLSMNLSPVIADIGFVPVSWLVGQVQGLAAFKHDHKSPSQLLDEVLKQLDGEGLLEYYHQSHKGSYVHNEANGVTTRIKAAVINARAMIETEVANRTNAGSEEVFIDEDE
jgi:hypothetical protein